MLSEGGGIFCDGHLALACLFKFDEGRLLTVVVVLKGSDPTTRRSIVAADLQPC